MGRYTVFCRSGTSTKMPQMPTTTEGMAASRSTTVSRMAASHRGAYSALKIATPIAGPNERASAAIEVIIVPRRNGHVPNTPRTGSQVVPVRKPKKPKRVSGSQPSRRSTNASSRASTTIVEPRSTTSA